MNFFQKKGEPFASNVDVKRLARALKREFEARDLKPVPETDQLLEMVAKGLGTNNYHDLLQQSKDPDITGLDHFVVDGLIRERAISSGQKFPRNLPSKFGPSWQDSCIKLFNEANDLREPGELDFVAFVGSEGSGKTLLAKHLTDSRGGYVVDIGIALGGAMNLLNNNYSKGALLVHDKPSRAPKKNNKASLLPVVERKGKLGGYIDQIRSEYSLGYQDFISEVRLREWVRETSQACFLTCFKSVEEVQDALDSSQISLSGRGSSSSNSKKNWRCAHVVDLDSLSVSTLYGPGYFMGTGEFEYSSVT